VNELYADAEQMRDELQNEVEDYRLMKKKLKILVRTFKSRLRQLKEDHARLI